MTRCGLPEDSQETPGQIGNTRLKEMPSGRAADRQAHPGEASNAYSYLPPVLEDRQANSVFHWVDIALQRIRDRHIVFPWSAYILAMPMVAGFLAAQALSGQQNGSRKPTRGSRLTDFASAIGIAPDQALGEAPTGADPQAAYGSAFATVMEQLLDCSCRDVFAEFVKKLAGTPGAADGIAWGETVARAVLASRAGDNSEPGMSKYNLGRYPRSPHPLKWEPAQHKNASGNSRLSRTGFDGMFAGFGKIRPWTMGGNIPFRPDLFHNPASPEFAEDYDLLRSVGGTRSPIRTREQTRSALFWSGIPGGVTISGHFLLIAIQVLKDRDLAFADLARVFALIGMVQCDVAIRAWDAKYHFDIMRPETAIRLKGQVLHNPDARVVADKRWSSLIPTPEYPSYVSGHSTIAAAVAEILHHLLQSDRIRISQTAPDAARWPDEHVPHQSWRSLQDMVEQCGFSRIYGGVNWRLDHERAVHAARLIARHAMSRFLPPEFVNH